MSKPNIHLFIIDPEDSFCNPVVGGDSGELYIPGAEKDIDRLSDLIDRMVYDISDITVTLDSHHELDVAHPMFWKDKKGKSPDPFTIIIHEDVVSGKWIPFNPTMPSPPFKNLLERMIDYTKQLRDNDRYALCIWPPHCRIGTPGCTIMPRLRKSLRNWKVKRHGMVNFVTKGSNWLTEHYSAVRADVPDPGDSTTQLNSRLIDPLERADIIPVSGQAKNFCVAETVRDVAAEFGPDSVKKLLLLEDTCSDVPGFEHLGEKFIKDMTALGMQITKSTDFGR